MDYFNGIVAVLALLVGGYAAYLQRRQVQMLEAGAADPVTARKVLPPWWRAPAFLAVAFMALLTWVPWIYGLTHSPQAPITTWVTYGLLPDGRPYITIDLKEAKPDRKVIAIALHYYGTVDAYDQAAGLQKSKLFEYRSGPQTMIIGADEQFLREAPGRTTTFFLVDVPNGISEAQFSTLHQATNLGARIIYLGARS